MAKKHKTPDDVLAILKLNVRLQATRLGLTQTAVSERMGLTPSAVTRIINGNPVPNLRTLVRLAKALECELWELLRSPNAPTTPEDIRRAFAIVEDEIKAARDQVRKK